MMLTPITIQTYNTLLAKEKTLIEMFFDVGISLATTKSNYMNDFIASLATFTNANEANMHIQQIQEFYNECIDTFEALEDDSLGYKCDAVIDTLLTLENIEKTQDALYSASLHMLEVLIQEFHLEEAIEPIAYNEMEQEIKNVFGDNPELADAFLELLGINTMLRKGKGADEEDIEDFTYKMYATCQQFNRYRQLHLQTSQLFDIEDKEKNYSTKVKKLFTLGRDIAWDKNYSYVKNIGITLDDTQDLLLLANDLDIYDYDNYTDENENIFFAIVHSWKALSELKVLEAKPLFLEILLDSDEDDDLISELFPYLYSVYGDHEEAFSYILDENLDEYCRWTFINALSLMYKKELISRDIFISYINKALLSVEDDVVNAALVSECMNYKLKESYLSIVHVFDKDSIDYSISGDLAYVEKALEIGEKDNLTQRDKQSAYSKKGIGRNDPCPCGSGKKYKKCCL